MNTKAKLALGVASAVSMYGAAHAQTGAPGAAAEEMTSVDEVVVTARLRAESIQDVPVSVSVVGGEALQRQNVSDLQGLQSVVGGLVIRKNPNNVPNVAIRGVGTGTGNQSFEQSAAIFLDGAYISRGPQSGAAFFDVQQVELIKGTQASLLAKNTSLGAVKITSRKPGDAFGYDLVGSYDFELKSRALEAGVDLPVNDTFKMRLSGQAGHQGGWLENRLTGDENTTKTESVRLVVDWRPMEGLEVTGLVQGFKVRQRGVTFEYLTDVIGRARTFATALGHPDFEINRDQSTIASDIYAERTTGAFAIGTINYRLGDFTLTSVSAYSTYKQQRPTESSYLPGDVFVQNPQNEGNDQFTQEVRLSSPLGGRLDYVVGAFYQHEDWAFYRTAVSRPPVPLTGSTAETFEQRTQSGSLFGQVNVKVAEQLSASLGLRGTRLEHDVDLSRTTLAPGPVTVLVYPPYALTHLSETEESLDGSVGAQYRPNDDTLVFVSWSKGTKSGGFLTSGTRPSTAAYKPEVAKTWEAGAKFTLGPRSYANLTIFNTRLDNFQQAVFNGTVLNVSPRDIRSRGVEGEFAYQPLEGLRLAASLTYADTERLRTGAATPGDGTPPMGAAKWNGNVGVGYEKSVAGDLVLNLDVGVEFRSRILLTDAEQTLNDRHGLSPTAAVVPSSPAVGKLNARLGLTSGSGWEIALVGRNLTNEHSLAYGIPAPFVTGASVGMWDPPRTVAVQLILRR